jgi:HEAT repeat protein
VREQAMRAIAMIQPPETPAALTFGLKDGSAEIRKVASAGWIKAPEVPEEVVPALVECLRDPEAQVRANAAHVLARLESLPAEAVPLLVECTVDPDDGLRIKAAMALKNALLLPEATAALEHLLADPNARVRLLAAGALISAEPDHPGATAVVAEALNDPAYPVRKGAIELVESLGPRGAGLLGRLKERVAVEDNPALGDLLERVIESVGRHTEQSADGAAGAATAPPVTPPEAGS